MIFLEMQIRLNNWNNIIDMHISILKRFLQLNKILKSLNYFIVKNVTSRNWIPSSLAFSASICYTIETLVIFFIITSTIRMEATSLYESISATNSAIFFSIISTFKKIWKFPLLQPVILYHLITNFQPISYICFESDKDVVLSCSASIIAFSTLLAYAISSFFILINFIEIFL